VLPNIAAPDESFRAALSTLLDAAPRSGIALAHTVTGEPAQAGAEGATAPETLRPKDRNGT